MLRFAVIGCNVIARKHAEGILAAKGAQLAVVCDLMPDRAAAFAAEYGAEAMTDYEAVLSRSDIDVVNIVTPNWLHQAMGLAAAAAGKHAIIEKPLSMDLAGARSLAEAFHRAGLTVVPVMQKRLEEPFATMKRIADAGLLGNLTMGYVQMLWNRSNRYWEEAPWRGTRDRDGGMLLTQAIHYIDMLIHVMGPVRSAFAFSDTLVHTIETEDTTAGVLRFESGAMATVEATVAASPRNLAGRLGILGRDGAVAVGGTRFDEPDIWQVPGGNETMPAFSNDGHERLIAGTVSALQSGSPPPVTPDDTIATLAVLEALLQSGESGLARNPAKAEGSGLTC